MDTNLQYTLITTPDYINIRDAFCKELNLSSSGVKTSLPFIKNHLTKTSLVKPLETFQVFSIGGTSGEIAIARYLEDGNVEILEHEKINELPKFRTVELFLEFLDEHFDKKFKAIGLNFAFTLIPQVSENGELDGIMISGDTKGHAFIGLQDKLVGKCIKDYFKKRYGKEILVSVGNDTVCLMASAIKPGINKDKLAAGIVGTGYNLAFFLEDNTIINTQASDFKSFTQTQTGKFIDAKSSNIGAQLFNKEIAGGELYKHFNALIPMLDLSINNLSSTKELSAIALIGHGKEQKVAKELLHRSASLVAANLAALYNFKNRPDKMTFVMEGSLFWEAPGYNDIVSSRMVEFGIPQETKEFIKIENSDILGAAKLITG